MCMTIILYHVKHHKLSYSRRFLSVLSWHISIIAYQAFWKQYIKAVHQLWLWIISLCEFHTKRVNAENIFCQKINFKPKLIMSVKFLTKQTLFLFELLGNLNFFLILYHLFFLSGSSFSKLFLFLQFLQK